jgi:osmotically-inducible protein OsmY
MKTDKQLRTDVQDELEWEPSISDAETIGVAVEDGIVTLTGSVKSFSEKWAAENAAERVAGVKAVSDDLEVHLASDYSRTDTDIARAAVDALRWNVNVPTDRVKVTVENGFVTLQGDVDYKFQKEAAADGVRHLTGVTGLSNQIDVKPSASAGAIKDQIEKAFKRSAEFDATQISVRVSGGKVTLSGRVSTWLERDDAEDAAWRAPGVFDVENDLTIAA